MAQARRTKRGARKQIERRPRTSDLALNWDIPAFSARQLQDLVRAGADFEKFFRRLPVLKTDLSRRRPSEAEIEAALRQGLADAVKSIRKARKRPPNRREIEALLPVLRREFDAVLGPSVDGDLISRNLAASPLLIRVEGRSAAFFIDGNLGGVLLNTRGPGDQVVIALLIIDFALEIIGMILGLIGLRVPKSSVKPTGPLLDLFKKERVRDAFKQLVKGTLEGDGEAVIQSLLLLRELGVLGEILSGYLADLGPADYAKLVAKFFAFLILAFLTAGGAFYAKLAQLLLNLVELISKGQQLQKILKD